MLIKMLLKLLGVKNKEDIFYIGGTGTLPAPLTAKEEAKLIEKLTDAP